MLVKGREQSVWSTSVYKMEGMNYIHFIVYRCVISEMMEKKNLPAIVTVKIRRVTEQKGSSMNVFCLIFIFEACISIPSHKLCVNFLK